MAASRQLDLAQERRDRKERCWLCGVRLPVALMVPDGGSACADVRWYCRDMRACTERWTKRPPGTIDVQYGAAGPRGTQLTAGLTPRR